MDPMYLLDGLTCETHVSLWRFMLAPVWPLEQRACLSIPLTCGSGILIFAGTIGVWVLWRLRSRKGGIAVK